MRDVVVALLVALFLAAVPAGSASAVDLFESLVVGKQVAFQEIAGISPDLAEPWVVEEGKVKISSKKSTTRLEVDVEGLLLLDGTVGPVVTVFASLVCQKTGDFVAGEPTNEVVASTGDVPLSAAGDAEIEETIDLPPVCVAPIVLIRINLVDFGTGTGPFPISALGIPEPWIAASGF